MVLNLKEFKYNIQNIIYQMKDKLFFGIVGTIGGISMASGIQTIYNYYILPVIRHREVMDKIDGFDTRLKTVEKEVSRENSGGM